MTTTATRFTVDSALTLHRKAHAAGMAAGEATAVPVSIVGSAIGLSSVIDTSKKIYVDYAGPCGFAWVKVKGNTSFGRAAKKAGLGTRSDYYGGILIRCREFDQSYLKKDAYVGAYAAVLAEAGVEAFPMSRLD